MAVFCNPLNINYRYQFFADAEKGTSIVNREAADPSLIYYHGTYYIFASMTLGVWVSKDLAHWENHKLPETLPLYDYAPDVRVVGDWVVVCASRGDEPCNYYRTKDILHGPYEEVKGTFPFWDPNVFQDDDGRVYFYWGCSNVNPIYGQELDPKTLQPLRERQELIQSDPGRIGYERVGENHSLPPTQKPYIEGAWVNKHGGKYYLQYACPGTEFNTYGDGVYVSDSPLGPYVLADNNPFSYKPGGFMTGAGHGSTEYDADGKLWHVATMRISMHHLFERRVGLWRAGFDADGELFCNQRYGDWPMRTDVSDPWAEPEWMLLSYGSRVSASSQTKGHGPELASDENVRTWWQAGTSDKSEWICLDLGKVQEVHAVQINFADDVIDIPSPGKMERGGRYIDGSDMVTRWILEGSADGETYEILADKSAAGTDLSHDLVVFDEGRQLRYLRLRNMEVPYGLRPCISGIRVFGKGSAPKPEVPAYTAKRIGEMNFAVSMDSAGAAGYNVLWGSAPDKLYHSCLTFDGSAEIGALVSGRTYFVRVDAWNESGITHGEVRELKG